LIILLELPFIFRITLIMEDLINFMGLFNPQIYITASTVNYVHSGYTILLFRYLKPNDDLNSNLQHMVELMQLCLYIAKIDL
jgi:hypothetical protein